MDKKMAMAMAMELGMDWAALEAEAETTGTPAACAVCMAAAMAAEEAGTTPPPACPGCPMEDDAPTPTPTGAEAEAAAGLVAAWDAMVAEGEMDEAELAETLAMELARWGWDPELAELEDMALALARAAQELEGRALAQQMAEAGELG